MKDHQVPVDARILTAGQAVTLRTLVEVFRDHYMPPGLVGKASFSHHCQRSGCGHPLAWDPWCPTMRVVVPLLRARHAEQGGIPQEVRDALKKIVIKPWSLADVKIDPPSFTDQELFDTASYRVIKRKPQKDQKPHS